MAARRLTIDSRDWIGPRPVPFGSSGAAADLVVALPTAAVDTLVPAFPLEELYCPQPEVIRVDAARPLA